MLYTEAMKSAQQAETVQAFKRILAKASEPPLEINTDKGNEFTSTEFADLLKAKKINHRFKESDNDLATLDLSLIHI